MAVQLLLLSVLVPVATFQDRLWYAGAPGMQARDLAHAGDPPRAIRAVITRLRLAATPEPAAATTSWPALHDTTVLLHARWQAPHNTGRCRTQQDAGPWQPRHDTDCTPLTRTTKAVAGELGPPASHHRRHPWRLIATTKNRPRPQTSN